MVTGPPPTNDADLVCRIVDALEVATVALDPGEAVDHANSMFVGLSEADLRQAAGYLTRLAGALLLDMTASDPAVPKQFFDRERANAMFRSAGIG